jgi:Fe-S-cluster containining protein
MVKGIHLSFPFLVIQLASSRRALVQEEEMATQTSGSLRRKTMEFYLVRGGPEGLPFDHIAECKPGEVAGLHERYEQFGLVLGLVFTLEPIPGGKTGSGMQRALDALATIPYPCNGCTACCRSGMSVVCEPDQARELGAQENLYGEYVLPKKEDGKTCAYLGCNGCTIYARRPSPCRTYRCAAAAFCGAGMSREEVTAADERLRAHGLSFQRVRSAHGEVERLLKEQRDSLYPEVQRLQDILRSLPYIPEDENREERTRLISSTPDQTPWEMRKWIKEVTAWIAQVRGSARTSRFAVDLELVHSNGK